MKQTSTFDYLCSEVIGQLAKEVLKKMYTRLKEDAVKPAIAEKIFHTELIDGREYEFKLTATLK